MFSNTKRWLQQCKTKTKTLFRYRMVMNRSFYNCILLAIFINLILFGVIYYIYVISNNNSQEENHHNHKNRKKKYGQEDLPDNYRIDLGRLQRPPNSQNQDEEEEEEARIRKSGNEHLDWDAQHLSNNIQHLLKLYPNLESEWNKRRREAERVASSQQNSVGQPLLSNYIRILNQMKNNLDTLYKFTKHLPMLDPDQRQYMTEWCLMMDAMLQQLIQLPNSNDHHHCSLLKSDLKNLIFKKLDQLQQPKQLKGLPDARLEAECKKMKKLLCNADKLCGFGCRIHHQAYCFIAALALNRTLILEPRNLLDPSEFWPFQSVQSICAKYYWNDGNHSKHLQRKKIPNVDDAIKEQAKNSSTLDHLEYVRLPLIDFLDADIAFRPLAIPKELQKQLEQLTSMPFLLFVGNILAYIMRLDRKFEQQMKTFHKRIGLLNQQNEMIVGVHVRRTDKIGLEAKNHSLKEYMDIVSDIYDQIDVKDQFDQTKKHRRRRRKVYLATDDALVWLHEVPYYIELGYRFYGGGPMFARDAEPENRYKKTSLEQTVMDVYSLSYTDYLVCTLSSQICRLAFELMQTHPPKPHQQCDDMTTHVYSLDDTYYYGGQMSHRLVAIMANNKVGGPGEHRFNLGDTLGIQKDSNDGYLLGDLKLTNGSIINSIHKYPKFKVIERVDAVPFKAFAQDRDRFG